MCYDCWKEFKGWCKSFTRTEALLAILEGILLIICIMFIVFLIMHFTVCPPKPGKDETVTSPQPIDTTLHPSDSTPEFDRGTSLVTTQKSKSPPTTLDPGVKCTWEPSKKTAALTHYYESNSQYKTQSMTPVPVENITERTTEVDNRLDLDELDELSLDDQSDGEEADDVYKSVVLALVKRNSPKDITFGCILTVITEYWTVTAASCIESIEEVDSLDNFVMQEEYGGAGGRALPVRDVRLHPLYGGHNRSYDVAALRSGRPLRPQAALLPTLVDYFLLTVGERLTVLGFGPFRSAAAGADRSTRAVRVYALPGALCAASARDGWAARHLGGGQAQRLQACGAAALCAGVLYARGAPCSYCAGTPLLRARTLLALMSDTGHCGVSCEPALYVNVAVVRDWLDMVVNPD